MARLTSPLFACLILGLVLVSSVPSFAETGAVEVEPTGQQAPPCNCDSAVAPFKAEVERIQATAASAQEAAQVTLASAIQEKDAAISEVQTLRARIATLEESSGVTTRDLAAVRAELDAANKRAEDAVARANAAESLAKEANERASGAAESSSTQAKEVAALQKRAELAESRLGSSETKVAMLTDQVKSAEIALAKAKEENKAARDPSALEIAGFLLESIWSVVENGLRALAPAWNLLVNQVTSKVSVLTRAAVEAFSEGSNVFHANVWTKVEPTIRPGLKAASPYIEKAQVVIVNAVDTARTLVRDNVSKLVGDLKFVTNDALVTDAVCSTADAIAAILLSFVGLSVLSTTCACCCSKKRRPSKRAEKILKMQEPKRQQKAKPAKARTSSKPLKTEESASQQDDEPKYEVFLNKNKSRR